MRGQLRARPSLRQEESAWPSRKIQDFVNSSGVELAGITETLKTIGLLQQIPLDQKSSICCRVSEI
jgi:hypothetical protein